MKQKEFFFVFLLALLLHNGSSTSLKFAVPNEAKEKHNDFWYALGKKEIEFAMNRPINNKVAKNIVFFLGDGMGITVSTAGRIYKGQKNGMAGEEGYLEWERFPNAALIKTYTVDKQVPDSAGTATAFFSGVKSTFHTVGVNGNVKLEDCQASLKDENRVSTILSWAQEAGKETGIVTTARVSHATPSALYAHSADRYWECDSALKNSTVNISGCRDIAAQLVEDSPGKNVKVVFAGGRLAMGAPLPGDAEKVDADGCFRTDDRNLVQEWLANKTVNGSTAQYVTTNAEFQQLDVNNLDYIMGLFGAGHMPWAYQKDDGPQGVPSIKELTEVAIKRLQRSKDGFFLMVEGGRIDHGLHATKPHIALEELVNMEEAVQAALKLVDLEDTLVIVTADHSHVMTMNGYPDRGNDILGTTLNEGVTDNLPYTTLMFTNGAGANFTWNGHEVVRSNVSGVDTRDFDFMPQAAVPVLDGRETHGGEDVALYATGPMSHLFHRLHEQSYIAHVMAFASCVGPFADNCQKQSRANIPTPQS